eukprot:jgi/Bigna1/73294/fgenesh1_pg.23_\
MATEDSSSTISPFAKLLWQPALLLLSSDREEEGEKKPSNDSPAGAAVALVTSKDNAAARRVKWKQRDCQLQDFMRKLPKNSNYRVSFEDGMFAFVDTKNTILAKAGVKLLLSYNLNKRTVFKICCVDPLWLLLLGWENPSVQDNVAACEVKDVQRTDVEQKDVDDIAYKIAEASHVDHIYRAINKTSWVFLGLKSLKLLDVKDRVQYNATIGWLELVGAILARLRKVIMMKQAPVMAIGKAYHDAGLLFAQQSKSTFSSNANAVKMLKLGSELLSKIAEELKTWLVRGRAHDQEHVRSILKRLLQNDADVPPTITRRRGGQSRT